MGLFDFFKKSKDKGLQEKPSSRVSTATNDQAKFEHHNKLLTKEDFMNNPELVIKISAESDDYETIGRKLEVALGKRNKTREILSVEQDIRDAIRELNRKLITIAANFLYDGDKSQVELFDTINSTLIKSAEYEEAYAAYYKKMEMLRNKANEVGVCYTIIQEEMEEEFNFAISHKELANDYF